MRDQSTAFDGTAHPIAAEDISEQQEAFCQAYVFYANAAHAAREAGYSPATARQQGHRLIKRRTIELRIDAIRRHLAQQGCRTTETLLGKLENIYNRALTDRAYHAASRAVEIQARMAGLMPSMHERLAANRPAPPKTAETRET